MSKHRKTSRGRRVLQLISWNCLPRGRGVADYARENGWSVTSLALPSMALEAPGALDAHKAVVARASERTFDGILAEFYSEGPVLGFCRALGIPVVDLAEIRMAPHFARVLTDDVAIGRMGAEHLLERGFRHFAFCTAYWHCALEGRHHGFYTAVQEAAESLVFLDRALYTVTGDKHLDLFSRDLSHLPKPLAVMSFNDDTARMALDACELAGLLVPEQVAIVGVDNNVDVCELAPVPLSSVDPDFYRQGAEAARLLDHLMDGEAPPDEPVRVPPKEVVVRESSNIVAVQPLAVARAVGFIRRSYANNSLRVDDIAAACGLSRRALQNAFGEAMKCTLSEYIRRTRLEHATRLLRETDRPAKEIAVESGFSSTIHLAEALHVETGLRPRAWRKEHQKKQ